MPVAKRSTEDDEGSEWEELYDYYKEGSGSKDANWKPKSEGTWEDEGGKR